LIHPTAIIADSARLGTDVSIGPWCDIGEEVEIGDGTWIGPHVVIRGPTRIGEQNKIYQFNSIGDIPQDKKFHGERSSLEIGDRNVIREFCTFNRGTEQGGGVTRVGDDNWIMAYVHIAHDCLLGNEIIMANAASLAGHVVVEDRATLGGFTVVHQFCSIGAYSFTALGSVIRKDVPPFVMASGNFARPYGLNGEGLKRRGFDQDSVRALKQAYKTIYKQGLTIEQALDELDVAAESYPEVQQLAEFIRRSSRGIVR
jgi:UDP-N-acetylglucosamine acyltransferase